MDIVHPRVVGLDVHKKVVWAAVRLPGGAPGERTVTVKRYRTFWGDLKKMAAWLAGLGVTDAALESTGVYWWPVYHALAAAGVEVCVCNAARMRNVPGRNRDVADCRWIAELHEHGLLRRSFIAAGAVAELWARTRYRKKLIEQRVSEGQRLSKVLEDAGIKIDSVASKLLGVSGRAVVEALIAGERNPGRLADLAKGRLRAKLDELQMACDGRFTAAHAQMCRLGPQSSRPCLIPRRVTRILNYLSGRASLDALQNWLEKTGNQGQWLDIVSAASGEISLGV
jgi:transposase